jgi:sporulation protein YlmC with PRC-barrel domain
MNKSDNSKIINLPVYTQSGIFLGRIVDFETDKTSGLINKYFVKSENPVKDLFRGNLEIAKEQVISIDEDKMVVEDTWRKVEEPKLKPVST